MVFGVGIDIENHNRFIKYHQSNEFEKFLTSVFSESELSNYALYNTHICYALSFTCKESFFKAFSFSKNNINIDWRDIELIFNNYPENKDAVVQFSGLAAELIDKYNIITPPDFNYKISESSVIFETVLSCKT